jgi:putative ABC transport system permease protein
VLIAFVIVVPLAWYTMNQWLADFAYQAKISPFSFLAAGLIILVIAFVSVFYQALKAAVINPSETLRSE